MKHPSHQTKAHHNHCCYYKSNFENEFHLFFGFLQVQQVWTVARLWNKIEGKIFQAKISKDLIFNLLDILAESDKELLALIQEWEKPSSNFLKLNIDAALFIDQQCFGLGLCIRDHSGGFVRARSFLLQGNPDPREAEVLGLLYALQWVSDFRVDKIIFELDSKIGVNEFNKHLLGNSEFHAIISRCKPVFSNYLNFWMNFVRKQANQVVHSLARPSKLYASVHIHDCIPHCISSLIYDKMK